MDLRKLTTENTLLPLTEFGEEQSCASKNAKYLVLDDWMYWDLFERLENLYQQLDAKENLGVTDLAYLLLNQKIEEVDTFEDIESFNEECKDIFNLY